jgi:hypothetical protein
MSCTLWRINDMKEHEHMTGRLRHITLKIKRAQQHHADLQKEYKQFLETKPYKVGWKHDINTRKLIYYVESIRQVPDSITCITGDIIQNLVTALDHMAYQLVDHCTGGKPPRPKKIYFPIADDKEKYDALKRSKLDGVSVHVISMIDSIEPYKEGSRSLWELYRLNIIEKHRLLLTVGSQAAGIHLGQLAASLFKESMPAQFVSAFEQWDHYLMPADKGFPLTQGFELLIGKEDEEPNPRQEFRFGVVLNENGIVEGKPLIEASEEYIQTVEKVYETMLPCIT